MKMRLWTYRVMAILVANVFLLGELRAAEIVQSQPVESRPPTETFASRLVAHWRKPPPAILSPVTVRLFTAERLNAIWITSPSGFYVMNKKIKGRLYISLQDGRMQVFKRKHSKLSGDRLNVRPVDPSIFEIQTPKGSHRWIRGELRLRIVKKRIQVVNRMELEDYVGGILEDELGTLHTNPEVLKAQAVVARTYVLSMRYQNHHGVGYEFCDRPHCQVFGGVLQKKDAAVSAILAKVRGRYLSYHGRPIAAFYHHNCGGMTSAVEDVWPVSPVPYLKAVPEPAGSYCRVSPNSQWHIFLSKRTMAACFRHVGWLKGGDKLTGVEVSRKDPSGRVQQLLIQSERPVHVSVGKFRNVINQFYGGEPLKSAMFTVSTSGGSYFIRGRGWGHGVGFCQEGAKDLARDGETYQEILAHYFPHTKLAKLR